MEEFEGYDDDGFESDNFNSDSDSEYEEKFDVEQLLEETFTQQNVLLHVSIDSEFTQEFSLSIQARIKGNVFGIEINKGILVMDKDYIS